MHYWVIRLFTVTCVLTSQAAIALDDRPAPWTHQSFDDDPADFTFAIVSDLQGKPRNRVFDVAIASLNLIRPEFVMSVGDYIPGYSDDRDTAVGQWDEFDSKVHQLRAPFQEIEEALEGRPYLSINGHWHNYMYYPPQQPEGAKHINLGTTARRSRNQKEKPAASGQRSALSTQLVELGAPRLDPEFLIKIQRIS